jgi:hypothetical protein
MIEMALETARRCEEKRAGRGLSPGRAVRHYSLQPFRRPEDMVFARLLCRKGSTMDKHCHRLCSSYPNEKPHTISTRLMSPDPIGYPDFLAVSVPRQYGRTVDSPCENDPH